MSFDSPLLLALAPLFAFVAGFIAWRSRARRIAHAGAWSPGAAAKARSYGRAAPVVIGLAVLAVGVGLAGPRGGRTEVTSQTRSLNVVLAMDISRSMLAEDADPNRLDHAIREARRLVLDLGGDRVGLIGFAGRSYILSPLTVDEGAILIQLDALDPDLASEGGTSLGSMLVQGRGLLLASQDAGDRVLVVFTDGEALDSVPEAVDQARALAEAGIRLVLVGEGKPSPVRIPIRDSTGALVEYKLDMTGRPVETARRDDILQRLADAAEGTVVSADLPDQASAVRELLASFKRAPATSTRTADLIPRGWIPVLIGAVLLLLHTLTRRQGALIALAALCLPLAAQAQTSAAERALEAGDPSGAARRWLEAAGRGGGGDTAWYNAGTAAMAAGNLDVARRALTEAAKSADPALRYRALYNLGVASLLAVRAAGTPDSQALYTAAEEAFKQALLLQPRSDRAKWNLELTLREKPPQQSSNQNSPPPPTPGGGGQSGEDQEQPPPPGGITKSQADQILNSVEREERSTRERHQKRDRAPGMGGGVRDW